MDAQPPGWPDEGDGLLVGEASGLLGLTPKAIRTYHERGLIPEPERDVSGYRRYSGRQLVALARIKRLRDVGFGLRDIAALLGAEDAGVALRHALGELDVKLELEIRERRARRAVVRTLLDEAIDDPLAATQADEWEEFSIALLRRLIPGLTPEAELFERRFARALTALAPAAEMPDDAPTPAEIERALLDDPQMRAAMVDQHMRFHALAEADPQDPRVDALIGEFRESMAEVLKALAPDAPQVADEDPADMTAIIAGLAAAVDLLPPAQRRLLREVFADLLARP